MLTLPKKKTKVKSKKAAKKAPRNDASKAPDTGTVENMTPPEAPQGETSSEVEAAHQAVQQFEELREQYNAMWEQFRQDYPEAYQLFVAIEDQKIELQQQALEAKEFVRDAKATVGEFVCTLKHTKPKYDPDAMFEIMGKLLMHAAENAELASEMLADSAENGTELDVGPMMDHINSVRMQVGIINELIRAQGVKSVSVDQAVMKVLMPRNPDISNAFNDAYDRGGTPLTPSVEIPKIS
jgi:hypothetical protein